MKMMLLKNKIKFITSLSITGLIGNGLLACSKSNSFEISWLDGTIINCMSNEYDNYHSVNEIKNAIKQKAEVASDLTISVLPLWFDSDLEKEKMYYDLIASLVFNSNFVSFLLKLSTTDNTTTNRIVHLTYKNKVDNVLLDETISGFLEYKAENKVICIYLDNHKIANSYRFSNTVYEGE